MHRLEKIVKSFQISHNKNEAPLLLALSGGSDSIALFHIFIHEKIVFHVAHVNHKWRRESDLEEKVLKDLCEKQGIPFHLKRLSPETICGNLEDVCRRERLLFFKELVYQFSLHGVVLGHHLDDQAETVLKRIFEGATLSKLKGLSLQSEFESISLFRPFLKVKKKEILAYLEEKGLSYFVDETNFDTKYLRARMRKEIFPTISKEFGKEVVGSLSRLGDYSEELNEFLENFLIPFRRKMKKEGDGYSLDLENEEIETTFAWKLIIKDFLNNAGVTISQPALETILMHMRDKPAKKELIIGEYQLKILKKSIYLSPKNC